MSLPILIIGGTKISRKERSQDLAASYSSPFDTHLLDTKEAFGIGDVRALNANLSRRPFESSFQTVVLLEAQNLTIEAQNALLKTLEESFDSVKIILTSPTAESLLSTISSRCQKMQLPLEKEEVNPDQFKDFLHPSFYRRYTSANNLDLDSWLVLWHKILLANFGVDETPLAVKGDRQRILNYVKLLCKSQTLLKRKVSPKLLKTFILLEAPAIAVD